MATTKRKASKTQYVVKVLKWVKRGKYDDLDETFVVAAFRNRRELRKWLARRA